jgi:ElaB/YqjD/DUF883 family membrane-anchored ribosome-binding protein
MSYDSQSKSSAQLEREVEEQRDRVEARIGEIKDRLSPGQLLDEALAYTKDGGQQFAGNLGHTISANPLPATLLGVSLIWLMSGQGQTHQQPARRADTGPMREPDYPYARISGSGMRRTGHRLDDQGQWWSEFETSDGGRYRARSNEKGHRFGHFMDESGKLFGGFIDEAGNRIKQFQDESGNLLDEATGWAAHGWSDLQHGIAEQAQHLASSAQHMGQAMQKQTDQLTRQIGSLFEQQPLIAGALAFAAGAALGAALPHTREEDKLVGDVADKVRREAGHVAGDLYEKGKEQAGQLYEDVAAKAGEAYDDVKEKLAGIGTADGPDESQSSYRH